MSFILELKPIYEAYVYSISVDWMVRNLYITNYLGITVVRVDNINDHRVIISNETSIGTVVCHPYRG